MVKPLLDIEAVASQLGVKPRYVRRLVAERRIPFYKVEHFIRFDPDDLTSWLAERHQSPRQVA